MTWVEQILSFPLFLSVHQALSDGEVVDVVSIMFVIALAIEGVDKFLFFLSSDDRTMFFPI